MERAIWASEGRCIAGPLPQIMPFCVGLVACGLWLVARNPGKRETGFCGFGEAEPPRGPDSGLFHRLNPTLNAQPGFFHFCSVPFHGWGPLVRRHLFSIDEAVAPAAMSESYALDRLRLAAAPPRSSGDGQCRRGRRRRRRREIADGDHSVEGRRIVRTTFAAWRPS